MLFKYFELCLDDGDNDDGGDDDDSDSVFMGSLGIEVDFIETIDIDTAEDLEHAERLAGTSL